MLQVIIISEHATVTAWCDAIGTAADIVDVARAQGHAAHIVGYLY